MYFVKKSLVTGTIVVKMIGKNMTLRESYILCLFSLLTIRDNTDMLCKYFF